MCLLIYFSMLLVGAAAIVIPINSFSIVDFISGHGYPVEVHVNIITDDGYLLDMYRIPHGKLSGNDTNGNNTKPVVLLMHGLLGSAENWIVLGPKRGLAFQLADRGYDVWLGNARGCMHSRKHLRYNPSLDSRFWQFSWHEIGYYDLPAKIDYILLETNQTQIFYIGHSQGTTAFYVMASQRPEYNNLTRLMISFAPVAYMGHIPHHGIRFLSQFTNSLNTLTSLAGINEFLPNNQFLSLAGQAVCLERIVLREMCANMMFLICGYDSDQLDRSLIPRILKTSPAGAASRQILHYGQNIASGKFRQYDYGLLQNALRYHSSYPPEYDLGLITTPTALFLGKNDWLSSVADADLLYSELGNPVLKYLIPHKSFNHLDFIFASDINNLLYTEVFRLMDQFI